MPVLPYHKYIGPGNSLNNGLPVDSDDLIALEHDQAYEHNPNSVASADTHAIHDFIGDFQDNFNIHSAVGALGLSAKKGIESIIGQQYPMSKRHASPDSSQETQLPKTPRSEAGSQSLSGISSYHASQETMDTNEAEAGPSNVGGTGSLQNTTRSGLGGGAGPGGGGQGTNVTNLFQGSTPPGTPFKRHYKKVYRFAQPASLTSWARHDIGAQNTGYRQERLRYKIGSSTFLPLLRILFYMDPREYYEIVEHMGSFHIDDIDAEVFSLGVRVPFNTNQSNIEVANNNLHIPVMDLSPLLDHYPVRGTADEEDLAALIRGEKWLNYGNITDPAGADDDKFGINFPNIAAYSETRIIRNRAILDMPMGMNNQIPARVLPEYFTHSTPKIMDFCKKMILGTNYLGPAFHFHRKVDKTFWKRTCTRAPITITTFTPREDILSSVYDPMIDDDVSKKRVHPYNRTVTGFQNTDKENYNINQEMTQLGVPSWHRASVYGGTGFQEGPEKPGGIIFAQYNIRNFLNDVVSDTTVPTQGANSIINTTFEFLLECNMHATGSYIAPIYYGLHPYKPVTDWFHPHTVMANPTRASTFCTTDYESTITHDLGIRELHMTMGSDIARSIPENPSK